VARMLSERVNERENRLVIMNYFEYR